MYSKTDYQAKDDSYFQHAREEMLQFIPKDAANILEVGCGDGSFGAYVKKNIPCTYFGIEPDGRFIQSAIEKLDQFDNSLFTAESKLPHNHFDCIVFNDVLEHLAEPQATLINCKAFLKENGVIVSSIPNIRHAPYLYRLFYLGEFQYENSGIMDKTHLRFFTKKSIKKMYQSLGFEVIQHVGINESLSPKFKFLVGILNLVTYNKFEDTKYQQYATVARKVNDKY
ncbi:Ubiquinone biosynthesis O-methyltransferase [Pedobacter sp. Bi27]|uniref:class I SAM-dependent methyltransferase n=1 Tax=Pedobacter sp. Bi27 TaxID=2822351 RepID=UPI001DD976B6|nr:class I SAM-dependent methyltransferase [Pedobacter sp. Bi27]CAH0166998.1 Ubiquinone biosynthesis O-methyltransferase [Pedobacter sp. Bi27]